MPKEPIRKKIKKHFHACESCGYAGGFHVTFRPTQIPKTHEIILLCPQCEQTYDVDWQIKTQ